MSSSHSTPSRRNSPDISGVGVIIVWALEGLIILGLTMLIVDTEVAKALLRALRPLVHRRSR